MEERKEWIPVKDYEELYEVSRDGRVKALPRKNRGKSKLMKPYVPIGNSRMYVGLTKNGDRTSFSLAKLVATAFVPNPLGCRDVHYSDGNTRNVDHTNLFWSNKKYRYGGQRKVAGRLRLEEEDVEYLLKNFTASAIANMYNISEKTVLVVLTEKLEQKDKGLNYKSKDEFETSLYYKSQGAWSLSPERRCFQDNKQEILTKIKSEKK